ncbi:Exostosin-2 [Manis pentadactyla]|nr:Exostosin-2 [Manis pentadactyla]
MKGVDESAQTEKLYERPEELYKLARHVQKIPSDSFKYLTWHNTEQHDIQGSQMSCPRVGEESGHFTSGFGEPLSICKF